MHLFFFHRVRARDCNLLWFHVLRSQDTMKNVLGVFHRALVFRGGISKRLRSLKLIRPLPINFRVLRVKVWEHSRRILALAPFLTYSWGENMEILDDSRAFVPKNGSFPSRLADQGV